MKFIYTLATALFFLTAANAQQAPPAQNPNNPTAPTELPVLLQMGGLPGIGTTLNQDYNCVGINPANLGMVTKGVPVVTFGLIGLSGSLTTNAVGQSTIKEFFSDSIPYQQALADGFANRGMTVALNIVPIGISVQIPKIGGFAFTVQDRIFMNIYTNPTFASVGFTGFNSNYFTKIITDSNNNKIGVTDNPLTVSNAFDGSYIKGSYTRIYALSYGRQLFNIDDNTALYVGASLKYIDGFAYADGYIGSDGSVNAVLSYSTTFSSLGDSNSKVNPGHLALAGPTPVGHCEAFDLGATLVLHKNIRVSASITDVGLGVMTWGGTTDEVINSPVDSFKNYQGVATLTKGKNTTTMVFTHPESFTAPLPTQLHLGGSIFLISKFVVAADIDVPLNSAGGNLEAPVTTLSGGYCPSNGFRLTLGFQNAAYAPLTIPLGIVVGTGKKAVWQVGFSYADMLNFFRSNSIALGGSFFFLRFRV